MSCFARNYFGAVGSRRRTSLSQFRKMHRIRPSPVHYLGTTHRIPFHQCQLQRSLWFRPQHLCGADGSCPPGSSDRNSRPKFTIRFRRPICGIQPRCQRRRPACATGNLFLLGAAREHHLLLQSRFDNCEQFCNFCNADDGDHGPRDGPTRHTRSHARTATDICLCACSSWDSVAGRRHRQRETTPS